MCRLRDLQTQAVSHRQRHCRELSRGETIGEAVSIANLLCIHIVHAVFARVQPDFRGLKLRELPSRYAAAEVFL